MAYCTRSLCEVELQRFLTKTSRPSTVTALCLSSFHPRSASSQHALPDILVLVLNSAFPCERKKYETIALEREEGEVSG
jgi:hypothetical protein